MESKVYMPTNQKKNKTGLLPTYFKRIGVLVMILAFIPPVIIILMHIQMNQAQKELFKLITFNVFILGLSFIAWAKDKVEDEMTIALRLKSMSLTFLWAVLYIIIRPLTDMLFKDSIRAFTAQELVFSMLLGYFILYYWQKKRR